MLLREVWLGDRSVELAGSNADASANTFTLLIGRNGCGKSRLLQTICRMHLKFAAKLNNEYYREEYRSDEPQGSYADSLPRNDCALVYELGDRRHVIKQRIPRVSDFDLSGIPEAERQRFFQNFIEREDPSFEHTPSITLIPTIIAVSSSPFDKFPILDSRRRQQIESSNTLYCYRGARPRRNST